VTAPEAIMAIFIGPLTLRYRRLHPDVRFDYLSAEQRLDMIKGEADVAFRAGGVLEGDSLIGTALPDIFWTAYCATSFAAHQALPAGLDSMAGHPCIGFAGPIAQMPHIKAFTQVLQGCDVVGTSNSVPNMAGMIRAGLGIGLLPCIVGDLQPDLQRCFAPPAKMTTPWWVLVAPEAWALPRVRSFVAYAAEALRRLRPVLAGEYDQATSKAMLQAFAGSDG
jgi:DNA-binding transcriptional LysR family regulator